MERVKTPFLWSDCILPCVYLYLGITTLMKIPADAPLTAAGPLKAIVLLFFVFPGIIHILERFPQYTISSDGLNVSLLGITVRKIHWSEISHAIYCYTWHDLLPWHDWRAFFTRRGELLTSQMIFVTMDIADPFDPKHHWRWWHRLTHLGSSLCIFLPRSNVTVYTDAFRKYYPKMERQSVEKPFG